MTEQEIRELLEEQLEREPTDEEVAAFRSTFDETNEELESEARQERIAEAARVAARESRVDNVVRTLRHEATGGNRLSRSPLAADRFGSDTRLSIYQEEDPAAAARERCAHILGYSRDALGSQEGGGGESLVHPGFHADVIMKLGELTPLASHEYMYIVPMPSDVHRVPLLSSRPRPSSQAKEQGEKYNDGQRSAFGEVELVARKFGDLFHVNEELFEDSPIELYTLLVRLAAEGMAETREDLYLNGGGDTAKQPEGILTHITPKVSEASTDVELIKEVESLYFGFRGRYITSPGGIWLTSPEGAEVLNAARGVNDRKLVGNPTQEAPFGRILGRPIFVSGMIPADPEGNTYLVAANLKFGYVAGLRRDLRVRASDQAGEAFARDQVAIKYNERLDGKIGQAEAIRVLSFPTTGVSAE